MPPDASASDHPPDPAWADADGAFRLLDVEGAPEGTFGAQEPRHPPLIDRHGRVRLSFSRIELYASCPRRFRYSAIDRLPRRPAPQLSFGTSIHHALEAFYDRKLPSCPSEEELLGFLYRRWDASGFAALARDDQLAYYRHAQAVLRRYHRRHAAGYRLPAATEARFELPIDFEAVVVGSIDRVDVDDDGRFHLVDYKTDRRVRDRAAVAGSLQLALYALACRHLYGALPATVALEFVVPGVTVSVPIEDLDLDAARRAVVDTAAGVRADSYAPTPGQLCERCDYRGICPAWAPIGATEELLGPAVAARDERRRRLTREVAELRELEAGVVRIARELDHRDDHAAPPPRPTER